MGTSAGGAAPKRRSRVLGWPGGPVGPGEEGAMRFMITFNHIDGEWDRLSPADREQHQKWLDHFVEELRREKGAELVFFAPPEARKTVRKNRDGSIDVRDGPYLASTEQEGGYYIIDAESLDEAVEWARRGRWLVGSNEVREIFPAED